MPAKSAFRLAENAETQNRTADTAIFSRVLYQLSYLGLTDLQFGKDALRKALLKSAPYFTYM